MEAEEGGVQRLEGGGKVKGGDGGERWDKRGKDK